VTKSSNVARNLDAARTRFERARLQRLEHSSLHMEDEGKERARGQAD
jgi:hypothetical protein